MTWGQPIGLNELMIINPGLPHRQQFASGRRQLYRRRRSAKRNGLFLGEDGNIYRASQPAIAGRSQQVGHLAGRAGRSRQRLPCSCQCCRARR